MILKPDVVCFNGAKSACVGDHQSSSEQVNIPTILKYPAGILSQVLKTICIC